MVALAKKTNANDHHCLTTAHFYRIETFLAPFNLINLKFIDYQNFKHFLKKKKKKCNHGLADASVGVLKLTHFNEDAPAHINTISAVKSTKLHFHDTTGEMGRTSIGKVIIISSIFFLF